MALSQTLPIFHVPQFLATNNHHYILHSLLLDTERETSEPAFKLFLLVLMSPVYWFKIRNSSISSVKSPEEYFSLRDIIPFLTLMVTSHGTGRFLVIVRSVSTE